MFNTIFFGLIGLAITIGFVLPYLLSANSNELTMLGVSVILGLMYGAGRLLLNAIKENK